MESTTKGILLGCGVALLLGLLLLGALCASCVYHFMQVPEGIGVVIEVPLDVQVGETFALTVSVTNERAKKDAVISDVDIGTAYLEHFVVVGMQPEPKSTIDNAPCVASRSFSHDVRFSPGETWTFRMELRAEHAGLFQGDLDVYEGLRCLTQLVQTSVTAAGGEEGSGEAGAGTGSR